MIPVEESDFVFVGIKSRYFLIYIEVCFCAIVFFEIWTVKIAVYFGNSFPEKFFAFGYFR